MKFARISSISSLINEIEIKALRNTNQNMSNGNILLMTYLLKFSNRFWYNCGSMSPDSQIISSFISEHKLHALKFDCLHKSNKHSPKVSDPLILTAN